MRAALLLLVPALLAAGCIVEPVPRHADHAPAAHIPSPASSPEAPSAPYTGQQMREIKALSEDEIAGYRNGAGLGYAKPAELNSYPGPLHALEMRERLQLSDEQFDAITAIRQDMLDKAKPLGERYLVIESEIEQGFRDGSLSDERLMELLRESGEVEAQLRFVHLDAHLDTRALLTRHQVALYDEARGYGEADHGSHAHG